MESREIVDPEVTFHDKFHDYSRKLPKILHLNFIFICLVWVTKLWKILLSRAVEIKAPDLLIHHELFVQGKEQSIV